MSSPYRTEREAELVVESMVETTPSVAPRLARFAQDARWNLYPARGDAVAGRLAEMWDVSAGNLRLCTGASDALRELVTAALLVGGSVAYPGSSFPGYVDHLPAPARLAHSGSLLDYGHLLADGRLSSWLAEHRGPQVPRVLVTCLPAAPLPTTVDEELEQLSRLADEHRDLHVVIDTAYCEWWRLPGILRTVRTCVDPARFSLVATASKSLGLAGLRLGAVVVGERTLQEVGFGAQRFSVSSLQLVAWEAVLDDLDGPATGAEERRELAHRQIREHLEDAGVAPLAEAPGLYISVPVGAAERLAGVRGKVMASCGVVRVRVDEDNVDWAAGPE